MYMYTLMCYYIIPYNIEREKKRIEKRNVT